MKTTTKYQHLLLAGSLLALSACAAAPPAPVDALQAADTAIANADKEHAAEFAPVEMRSAREKVAAARVTPKETTDESVLLSRRLAEEARADAELATSKTAAAKAEAINQELKKNGDTLRQETQRSSGG